MLVSVFDTLANLQDKPDKCSTDVRVHRLDTTARKTDILSLPISNLHRWKNLNECLTALEKWETFLTPSSMKFSLIFFYFHTCSTIFTGLYSFNATEAYRTMWAELQISSRSFNHQK